MNLTLLTMRLFEQPRTGGELCSARLIAGLAKAGHRLDIVGRGQGPQAGDGQRYHSVGQWLPAYEDMSGWQKLNLPLQALASQRAASVQRLYQPGSAALLRQLISRHGLGSDALIVDHLQALDWLTPWLHRRQALPPLMLVMHNLESLLYADRATRQSERGWRNRVQRAMLQREARLLQRLEQLALRQSCVLACLTEADAEAMREAADRAGLAVPVEVLPGFALGSAVTAAAASRLPTVAAAAQPAQVRFRRIGMIGTWTWAPNRSGLEWMLQAVLPKLPANCQLVLAGAGLEAVPAHPQLHILGRVDSVDSFYDAIDLVAMPSFEGSGIHEKAIEAIARGLPVVATPHALRGLSSALPQTVRQVLPDARVFAQACADVATDRAWLAGQQWNRQRQQRYDQVLQRCVGLLQARAVRSDRKATLSAATRNADIASAVR